MGAYLMVEVHLLYNNGDDDCFIIPVESSLGEGQDILTGYAQLFCAKASIAVMTTDGVKFINLSQVTAANFSILQEESVH